MARPRGLIRPPGTTSTLLLTLQTFLCLFSPSAYKADASCDDLYRTNWIPIMVMRCPHQQLTKSHSLAQPAPNPAGGLRNLGNGWRRGLPNSPQADPGARDEQASSSCSDNTTSVILGKQHKAPSRFHRDNGAEAPSSGVSGNFQRSWKPEGNPSVEEDEESRLPEEARGQGKRGELIPRQGSQAGSWKQSARQRGEAETGGVAWGDRGAVAPSPAQPTLTAGAL